MNEEITKGLFEEFETLKGQLVITDYHKVVKLVAIGECPEDYYYVVYDGKRLAWTSCLTRIIQLKGKIDDQDYFELERVYELNSLANESLWNTDDLENKKSYLEYLGKLSILPADHLLLTKLYLNDN
jgi:hypothetical protein